MKIALTGGIGSGKSLVSDIIMEQGFDVINADKLAKEILLTDDTVKSKIIKEFGKDSYTPEGINTKYIAEKVFINPLNVKKINSFVHPPTIKKIEVLAAEILKTKKMVFVESALVYEANLEDLFDYVMVVTADEDLRIKRVVERDKVSEEDVKVRMENQISEKEKRALADFVIENNSSIEELKNKVNFFITIFKSLNPQ